MQNKDTVFSYDLYRYYGEQKEPLMKKLFRPKQLKYLYFFRKINETGSSLLKAYYKVRLRWLSQSTKIQIPPSTEIGAGFHIGHCGRIIINPDSVIGKNVNIATGVTIGQENRGSRKGSPTISDDCWIGTNAVIVGRVSIGTDVLIAPLTYVNFDVPDHSIVLGNPGKIIPRENATAGYIDKKI